MNFSESAQIPGPATAVSIAGRAMGGQQPLVGAAVQLYAATTSGYAGSSTVLTAPVATTAGGAFTIPSGYSCASSATQVYVTVIGGNPGLSGGLANPQSALMAALGSCGNLSASTNIVINEATTVAAVWALAPFMADSTHIGTSATNVLGLTNAFLTAAQLVNANNGSIPGTLPANSIAPAYMTNTIANILSGCVNSAGGTAGDSSNCGKLFSYVTPAGGTSPTDTIAAALLMAQNPGYNVAKIYGLASTVVPFGPYFSTAPNDFALGIMYATTLPVTKSIAVDANQNVWVITSNGVYNLSNQGTLNGNSFGNSSFSPTGIAIDPAGSVWVGESYTKAAAGGGVTGYDASKLSSSSVDLLDVADYVTVGTATYSNGGIWADSTPTIGPNGEAWFWSYSLSEFSSGGGAMSPTTALGVAPGYSGGGYTPTTSSSIRTLAIDPAGNAWLGMGTTATGPIVAKFNSTGGALSPTTGYQGLSPNGQPQAIAFDHESNAWILGSGNPATLVVVSPAGMTTSPTAGYNAQELDVPINFAMFDGNDSFWANNYDNTSCGLVHFSHSGADLNGTTHFGIWPPSIPANVTGYGEITSNLAIDSSGNVWISQGSYGSSTYAITKMVGLAAPVVTPLSLAVKNNQLGARP